MASPANTTKKGWRRAWMPVTCGLVLAAAMPRVALTADPPRRVVSFNICADQLVVALADPAQIAGLSPYATDPMLSAVAQEARAFRRIPWHAESVLPLDPDLVLVGPRDRSVTRRLLGQLGFRVVQVDFVGTIAAAREQIRVVADLLGQPGRGEALLARLDGARRRLASVPRPPSATALLVSHGGYAEGSSSLAAALLAEAGLEAARSPGDARPSGRAARPGLGLPRPSRGAGALSARAAPGPPCPLYPVRRARIDRRLRSCGR
jgi:ABC-type Fe3+-hydroxamate transport system substrate-binding protein